MNIQLEISSKNKQSLQDFLIFLFNIKNNLIISYIPKQKLKKVVTILKSPHVNKSAQEQFEYRVYTKVIKVNTLRSINFLFILKKIKSLNFPGIKLKITVVSKFYNEGYKLLSLYLNTNSLNISFYKNFKNIKIVSYKIKKYLQLFDIYGEFSLIQQNIKTKSIFSSVG